MFKLVIVAALVAVTAADSGGGGGLYTDGLSRSRLSQQCAGVCKDSAKFSLQPGWTYVYDYTGTTSSSVAGSSNDTSQIKISAKAHIRVSPRPCELILVVRDVELFDSDGETLSPVNSQKEFAAELEHFPLRFSYQDGRVEQLCPSADEPTWALNIKRGLLSMFQNSMSDLSKDGHMYEKDVSGNCETTYNAFPMMWSDIKIAKFKNLQSCKGKGQHTLGLPAGWTNGAKSTPIIKSEQICEQTIKTDNGTYLANSRCQETHVFAPFSNGQSGISTIAEVQLTLDSITKSDDAIPVDLFVNKRTSLLFEYSSEGPESAVSAEDVWVVLNQLVDHSQLGVDRDVPQLFNQLVSLLARMDDQQLVKLFDEVSEPRTRGYLLDALPLLGSAGSVAAMYQIYAAGEVTGEEVDAWLTALAFHPRPSLEVVDRLGLFLSDGSHTRTWLAAGAVVHSYCKHDPSCQQRQEVQAILERFEAVLGQACYSETTEQQQEIILALKAMGNAGLINSLETLEKCFTKSVNALEVRLAAVAALRRLPCDAVSRLPLLRTLQNRQEDSELRIAAYLALLQCPSTSVLSQLRDMLRNEDTNQVLSFIWTHLTNIQESSSPWRKDVRQMLQDTYLANKFKTDARKFSRNYEVSAYSDILNSGVTADSNIIFSTKSYLPRSANLNLTLDLFGETINLFEIGTRVEGFESVVENIFGPKGLFPDESMQTMLKNMRESSNENKEVIRSFSESFTKGVNNKPRGTVFVRVLGNELYLSQFMGLGDIMELRNVKHESLKYVRESLASLFTNRAVDYSKSFRFINSEHVVPTILGMPLKVKVNGTASVGLQLKTEVDLEKIIKTSSGEIVFTANPSAAVNLDGEMAVDATFTQAGVEMKGSLSSNTYLHTNIKMEKGKVLDVIIDVPRDKIEVINVTSSVFLKKRNGLVEIEGVGEVSEHDSCSGVHVPTLSGMRVCSQYVLRNASAEENSPYFPLTGKFQYALALQKSDEFEFYQFHLKQNFMAVSDINAYKGRYYSGDLNIELDTPGSKVNRRVAVDLSFDTKEGNAKLEVASPAGSVEFTGRLAVDDRQTSGVAELGARVNGEDYAAMKLGLQTESKASTIKVEPLFSLQIVPNNVNVNISGHFHIVQGSKYSADVTAVGFTKQPLMFSGDLSGAKGRYSASLQAKAEAVDIKVNSNIVNTAAVSSCKTLVRYVFPGRAVQSVDFSGKIQSQKKGGFTKKQLLVNLQMSQLPQYNTKVGWILYRTKMYLDSNMELTVGKTQWKSQQMYHNNLQVKNKNFEAVLSLESPSKNLDYRAEIQYKTTDDKIHGHALAQLSKTKRFVVRADYTDTYPLRSVELEAATPWSRAGLAGELLSTPESQGVNSTVTVKWGPIDNPRWLSASGRYYLEETPLSATNTVTGKLEAIDWENPVEFAGLWRARFEDGLILSESEVTLVVDEKRYSLDVNYMKNPMRGKHDVKVELNLPENSYTGSFLMINNHEKKNVTVRLDLEKTLYFTTQLQMWRGFDLQLFWNYLEDRSQSVMIQYKNSPTSEIAIVSMPGHYASLIVDILAPGFSSMNITAVWGESEGSATNAILLSTYWNLNMSSLYSPAFGNVLMPLVEAKVQLTTPFVGFEQQGFILDLHGVDDSQLDLPKYSVIRKFKVLTNWQQQYIDIDLTHNATFEDNFKTNDDEVNYLSRLSSSSLACSINSSLEAFREVSAIATMQDMKEFSDDELNHKVKNHVLNVSFNKKATLAFNSTCTPSELSVFVDINDQVKEETIFSSELSVKDGSILVQTFFLPNKKILFKSTYQWPYNIVANLETPIKGFEKSTVQYNFSMDDEVIQTKLTGRVGKEFFIFSGNLNRSQSEVSGTVDVSSSSTFPDLGLKFGHEIYKDRQKSTMKESFAVSLSKGGKVLQSSHGLLSFTDHQISISSKIKKLETVVVFPGHSSSLNYTQQTQVKLTGMEVLHELNQLWNSEKIDVVLAYEGLNSIAGFLKRNNEKKAEFSYKKLSNTNYKTDFSLHGGYSMKHRLFVTDYPNWENFLAITSPSSGKVIMKNLQTMNEEKTSFVHKSTISINKEVAYIDFVYNLDPKSKKVQNLMFSTTTPWNHPVVAKYDLLIDTGATSKHELELKFKEKDIKGVFDVTSSGKKHSASFNLYSPFCKDLSGKLSFDNDMTMSKGDVVVKANEKQIIGNVEVMKTVDNPLFLLSINSSSEKILNIFSSYDIRNLKKEVKFAASYYEKEISFGGHYTFKPESINIGYITKTPFVGLREVSLDFDSKLSHRYSMFALNCKKDEQFLILSGTGTILNDLIKASISVDYSINNNLKKQSTFFEYNRGKESILISLNCKNNEINVVDFNINLLKEPETVINQDSYLFTYKSQTSLEILPDSDVEMRFIKNEKAQKITGDFNINNLQTTFKGENTLDSSGIGHLDFNINTPNHRVGLLLKHSSDDEKTDSYIMQIFNNGAMYIGSNVSIFSKDKGLHIKYALTSSVDILGDIEGTTVVLPKTNSFDFNSSLSVSGDQSNIIYKVAFDLNDGVEMKHNLDVLLTLKGSVSKFKGYLEYKHRNSELVYMKGEITDGKSAISNVLYLKESPSTWHIDIDVAKLMKFVADSNESGFVLSVKVSKTKTLPNLLINLTINRFEIKFETDNTLMGKIQFSVNLIGVKNASLIADFNGLKVNGVFHQTKDSLNLEVKSNIPDWRELNVIAGQSYIAIGKSKKYFINISKENQEVFHVTTEGDYNRYQGSGEFSLTMNTFFIDVDLKYEFSSVFSLDLNYNINGNKQHTGGKITFSPDTARLDLATPIKGFEDLTLTSSFNQKNKKIGLVFERNGKTLSAEISATVEKQRITFKGSVTDGKDEFIISIGAQNGTSSEPKSASFYITAFKNRLSLLMISLDGSYDLQTKAGIKFSFSSYFYKQLYLEITSLNENDSHSFIFNYIFGIDVAYSFKSTVIKETSKPKLTIESNFGPHSTHLDIWYDVENPAKSIALLFSHNDHMLLDILGKLSVADQDCKVMFTIDNKNVLNGVKNLNISGGYNFKNESTVEALILANNVKYFDLSMKSLSLYRSTFQSSLVPTKYINNSYYISLDYNLVLPDISISSHVLINEEYYKSKANLTWNESIATVFYELNTNAGYGFEEAVMSAHYKVRNFLSNSYFIDFTIDNSTLFHVASHISYPSKFSLDIVLPDSLFLPFVKEISVGFSLTEKEKKILFNYLSGSQDKKKFNLIVFLQENRSEVKIGRSELSETGNLQIDSFKFGYELSNNAIEFETFLICETNDLFTISFKKEAFLDVVESRTLFEVLFSPGNHHMWRVVFVNKDTFEFSGDVSQTEGNLVLTHPKTIYHDKLGLTKLAYTNKINDLEMMNILYHYDSVVHSEVHFKSPVAYLLKLLRDTDSYGTFANLELVHHAGVFNLIEEQVCEGAMFIGSRMSCDKLLYKVYQTGTKNPLSLQVKLNLLASELSGILTKGGQNFSFGGKANVNKISPICSSVNVYFNSSDSPLTPFSLRYETNCLNSVSAAFNMFEKDTHAVNVIFDLTQFNKNFYIHGSNLYYKDWNVSVVFNDNKDKTGKININIEDNSINMSLLLNQKHSYGLFVLETSYNVLEKIEISYGKVDAYDANKFNGKLKIQGSKANSEWKYEFLNSKSNGTMVGTITSGNELIINLKFENSNEFSVEVNKDGQLYEGKGFIKNSTHTRQGKLTLSLNGNDYNLNFAHFTSLEGEVKGSITLDTPVDQYYVKLHMQQMFDFESSQKLSSLSIKYKTPYYPLDSADLKVEYFVTPVLTKEVVSLKELLQSENVEEYDMSYSEIVLRVSLKTKQINIEDAFFSVSFGNKYSLNFKIATMKVQLETLLYNNAKSLASQTTIEVINVPYLGLLQGKTFLKVYFDSKTHDVLALFITPSIENVLVTSKSQKLIALPKGELVDSYEDISEYNRTTHVVYGKETVLDFASFIKIAITFSNDNVELLQYKQFLLSSQWQNNNVLKSSLDVTQTNNQISTAHFSADSKVVQFQSLYSTKKTDSILVTSIDLYVNKSFVGEAFNPKIMFKRETTENSDIEYSLNFTNGFSNDKQFSGRCSIKLPDLSLFSIDSNPSMTADIFLESYNARYESTFNTSLQRNKLDASIKWRKLIKPIKQSETIQFTSLLFGGHIQKNSAEFYFNDNKFIGVIESTKSITSVNVNLVNSKLNKNITVYASVQYSPLFLMTVSHTAFDSPCSIEVKIDRKAKSIESAVTVVYNSLKQQAFVNVYLDSLPRYVELIYIDIWQQTHEVSGQVEEKDNEVTIKGKINSPAMDENFLIITIGSNNDKFDLNLSDLFIFKAFKDKESLILNLLLFGNDYILNYKNQDGNNELKVESPLISGVVTSSLKEVLWESFATSEIHFRSYHFLFDLNKNQLVNISLKSETENLLHTAIEFENNTGVLQLVMHCDIFENTNSLNMKHTSDPVLLVLSVGSSYYLQSNLEIMLGIKNEDLITGIFEVKHDSPLLKSYLVLSKENRSLEMTAEAPIFSEMDKAKINGIFKFFEAGDCEMKLSCAISSAESLVAHVSMHLINSDEVFSSGMVVKSKLNNFNGVEISVNVPLQLSRDMKASFILQLPYIKSYELSSSLCISESKVTSTGVIKWQDLIYSFDYKYGDTPFYTDSHEWTVKYSNRKIQVGAWMKPKYPLTDYIYFLDFDDKRIIQLSHALILQHNHFKSKLILESLFKGHEKYGMDLELQNLKLGKIVRLLGSLPQVGTDIGIDFAFSYESLLNYAVLAQVRVPFDYKIKTARLTSLQKFQRSLNLTKLNHTLECDDVGAVGWEFEMYGTAPFFWQGDMSALETKVNINDAIYLTKIKSYLQPNKIQLSCVLEAPLANFQKGELHLSGTKQLVGSELLLSLNSNEIVNASISEDQTNNKHLTVLSKWRNILLTHLYEANEGEVKANGYICWDLNNKDTSHLGLSVIGKFLEKTETSVELILPSVLVPKLSTKTVFAYKVNQLFALFEVALPGLLFEGKIASDISPMTWKSGLQLKWTPENTSPKSIGLFYVTEINEDEVKTYFTLQHFALMNDVMLSTYMRNTLYGVHLQYSPLKEEEVTLELGYWAVQDGEKDRSGMKFTALHPASNTLIYSVANITSSDEFVEGGVSVSYIGKGDYGKMSYVELFGKKNRKTPQIFLGFSSNGNTLGVGGSIWKKDNSLQGVTVEARVNQNDPFRLEVVQNKVNPGIEAELSYSLSRTYRAYVGMPNNNELTAHLSHTMYGRPNTDALATLRLNSSRILWGKFEFPPMTQVGQEFYNGVLDEYSDVSLVSQAISEGFLDFFEEDFSEKVLLLLNGVSSQSDVLVKQTSLELSIVLSSLDRFGKDVQKCYELDHFYLKTGVQHIKEWWTVVQKYTCCVVDAVTETLSNMLTPVFRIASKVWQVVESVISQWKTLVLDLNVNERSPLYQLTDVVGRYRNFRRDLIEQARLAVKHVRLQLDRLELQSAQWFTQAELAVNEMMNSAQQTVAAQVERVVDYTQTLLAGFSVLGKTVEEMVDIVREGIYRIREVRYAMEWIAKAIDSVNGWFSNFRLGTYLKQLDTFFDKVVQLVKSDIEKNFGEYEIYLIRAQQFLTGQYEELSKIPQVHYIKSVINHIYQKAKWFWNYTKMNERLRDAARKHLENIRASLDHIENQLDREERDMRFQYEYNDENNSLTFTQELPFTWQAFNRLPECNMDVSNGGFSIPAQEYGNMVQTVAQYVWQDAKLLPYLLPPMGADALITGRKVVTFDNTYYEMPEVCGKYLLSADLYQETFSLILITDREQRDLLLTTPNAEILVKDNFEVYVDGKLENMPLTLKNGNQITLERKPHSVYISSEEGYSLECSTYQKQCRFHLRSWYTGKVAGLFGTYNNEPSDDFIAPNWAPTESIEDFVGFWTLESSTCSPDTSIIALPEEETPSHESMCELFFSSQSSPFYPCFHVVDPKAFYDMCLANSRKGNTCSSVFAYLTKCTSSGVQLWMPEFCVTMDIYPYRSPLLVPMDTSSITPSRTTADVVFVVEEADCVKKDSFDFPELPVTLNSELRAKGIKGNQFAFISFNSKNAQIQTMDGQIWGEDMNDFDHLISRLDTSSSSDSPSVYASALDLAASLQFRPGAAKLVVLIHCSSCPVDQPHSAVLERLRQQDISLHILQQDVILSKRGRGGGKAIGLEKSGAYPRKRLGKGVSPSPALLEQVSVPQDLCTPLVLGTNGTLFHLDVVHRGLRAWAGRVAAGAVPPTPFSLCDNTLAADNTPVLKCHYESEHRKLKEWDQTALDEYMDTSKAAEIYTEYEEVDR